MKSEKIAIYHIINFSSVRSGMNGSGFTIILHKDFVKSILSSKRYDGEQLTHSMLNILEQTLGKNNSDGTLAIRYFEDTWLLESLHIGGQCACFSAAPSINDSLRSGLIIKGHFKYEPHNIDSPLQAACLLSMWLQWFNTIITLTDFELPHRI